MGGRWSWCRAAVWRGLVRVRCVDQYTDTVDSGVTGVTGGTSPDMYVTRDSSVQLDDRLTAGVGRRPPAATRVAVGACGPACGVAEAVGGWCTVRASVGSDTGCSRSLGTRDDKKVRLINLHRTPYTYDTREWLVIHVTLLSREYWRAVHAALPSAFNVYLPLVRCQHRRALTTQAPSIVT